MISLETLSIEEQKYICDRIPVSEARAYFQKYPKQFNEIKPGFRPEKLSEAETLFQILTRNITKPFISTFLETILLEWINKIDRIQSSLVGSGYSEEEALIQAVLESPFCDNCALYFKLSDQERDEEYIQLFRESMSLLQRAADAETQENVGEELRNNQEQLAEAKETIEDLKTQMESMKSKAAALNEDFEAIKCKAALQKEELEKAISELASFETENEEMRAELEYYRRLNKYSDVEFEQDDFTEYQHVSVGLVKNNYNTGKPYIIRLADISNGEILPFLKDENLPPNFENRHILYCNNGVERENRIGIWSWSSEPLESDPLKDHVTAEYNQNTKLTEVVELSQCKSLGDIANLLGEGFDKAISGDKVLFVCKSDKALEGLLCYSEDLEFTGNRITLSSSVYMLPHYTINPSDIITLANTRFYRMMNLGVPQSIYRVRTPFDVVKGLILARTTLSSLRGLELTKKEAQRCKQFLENIPTQTLVEEFADAYACSEEEAQDYVNGFVEQADMYLSGNDFDINIISQALGKNPELVELCKSQLLEDWTKENEQKLNEAKAELDRLEKARADKNEELQSIEIQKKQLLAEISQCKQRIDDTQKLADDVEAKAASRIASAKDNIADFIAQMAFVSQPCSSKNNSDCINSRQAFSVLSNKLECIECGSVDDVDSFEEELTENFELIGYEELTAVEMAQAMSFGICRHLPIVIGENAVGIAQCLSATISEGNLYEIYLNPQSSVIDGLCSMVEKNLTSHPLVFLIHGVFDGYSITQFNEITNLSNRYHDKAIMLLSIQTMDVKMICEKAWNKAIYIDGDEGLTGYTNEPLHSIDVQMSFSRDINEQEYITKRKTLIPYSTILNNAQINLYSQYLTAYNVDLNESPTILVQIITVARSSGKENNLSALFRENGINNAERMMAMYINEEAGEY